MTPPSTAYNDIRTGMLQEKASMKCFEDMIETARTHWNRGLGGKRVVTVGAYEFVVFPRETLALKLKSRGLLIPLPNLFDIHWTTFSDTYRERRRLSRTQIRQIKTGCCAYLGD